MPGLSTYFQTQLLGILQNIPYTVATSYVSLHSGNPGQTGANELSLTAYNGRVSVSWNNPTGGVISSSAVVTLSVTAYSGTVSYFGIWDAGSAGNFLGGAALSVPQLFSSAGQLQFAVGAISLAFTD